MSSSDPKIGQVLLVADPGDDVTEVQILDGGSMPLEQPWDIGRVELPVDPGLYVIRFRGCPACREDEVGARVGKGSCLRRDERV